MYSMSQKANASVDPICYRIDAWYERRKLMGKGEKSSKKKALFKGLRDLLSVLYMLANIVKIIIELSH